MTWIKSMVIAFAMYSKIPMPRIEWNNKNMKYSLCFFPLIGVVIGVLMCGWWVLSERLSFGVLMRAAIACMIPVLVSGGIHLDGLLDTVDALSSYQPREKKLEILKDPHTGAFAIIGCVMYFILYLGSFTEVVSIKVCIIVSIGFVLSRALSGMSLVLFKSAKKEGLLYAFSSTAHRQITCIMLFIIILSCGSAMIYLDTVMGVALLMAAGLVFLYYRKMSYKQFGGITGDLAGFFLQICELVMIITAVLISKI